MHARHTSIVVSVCDMHVWLGLYAAKPYHAHTHTHIGKTHIFNHTLHACTPRSPSTQEALGAVIAFLCVCVRLPMYVRGQYFCRQPIISIQRTDGQWTDEFSISDTTSGRAELPVFVGRVVSV